MISIQIVIIVLLPVGHGIRIYANLATGDIYPYKQIILLIMGKTAINQRATYIKQIQIKVNFMLRHLRNWDILSRQIIFAFLKNFKLMIWPKV